MSYYKDIYNDFPLRCGKLWKKMRCQAAKENLDITLMLMTAAAGFATPYEHLKIQPGQSRNNQNHPAFFNFDESHYKSVLDAISQQFDLPVGKSDLFADCQLDAWYFTEVKEVGEILESVEKRRESSKILSNQKARVVVKILRNAFAHNNICAFNRKPSTEIDELAFFSEIRDKKERDLVRGYDVLSISALDLGFIREVHV